MRRRAGSCPPHGRTPPGPTISSAARHAIRSGLVAPGSQFRGTDLGAQSSVWPLAAGLGSNITARIISTDRGNLDLSNRPAGVPGTLQLTVLVPVLLNAPRRTQEDVAGIGTTWTLGDAEISVQPAILSKLKIAQDESEGDRHCEVPSSSSLCDSCGICLQPFQPGEDLTALPCATDICPSVWHSECVRKWLCQGQTPTCPLCRSAMEVGQSSASAQSPSPSFALEVRAALPLSATSGLQAAFSSGRGGTSNQLLQQLGQVIIQDILLLTLSQHTAGLSGIVGNTPSLPHLASSGLLNGATADASSALADLGGLLLQTLTTNGTLPVTLSAVETWGPGTSRDSPTHASNSVESGWTTVKGRGRGRHSKGRGKGKDRRGASWHHRAWHTNEAEEPSSSSRWHGRQRHQNDAEESSSSSYWQSRPRRQTEAEEPSSSSSRWPRNRQVWVPVLNSRRDSVAPGRRSYGKGNGKGASGYENSQWHGNSQRSWSSWGNHWDGGMQ